MQEFSHYEAENGVQPVHHPHASVVQRLFHVKPVAVFTVKPEPSGRAA